MKKRANKKFKKLLKKLKKLDHNDSDLFNVFNIGHVTGEFRAVCDLLKIDADDVANDVGIELLDL